MLLCMNMTLLASSTLEMVRWVPSWACGTGGCVATPKWAVSTKLKMLRLVQHCPGHLFYVKILSEELSVQLGEPILPKGHFFAKPCIHQQCSQL